MNAQLVVAALHEDIDEHAVRIVARVVPAGLEVHLEVGVRDLDPNISLFSRLEPHLKRLLKRLVLDFALENSLEEHGGFISGSHTRRGEQAADQ